MTSSSEEQYIPILYRHVYRKPAESDQKKVALKISYQLVSNAITMAEATQRTFDIKRRLNKLYSGGDVEDNINEMLARKRARLT